jgi:hypothetical protein
MRSTDRFAKRRGALALPSGSRLNLPGGGFALLGEVEGVVGDTVGRRDFGVVVDDVGEVDLERVHETGLAQSALRF